MGVNTISSRFLQKNIESCVGLGLPKDGLLSFVPGGLAALENPTQRFDGEVLYLVLKYAEHESMDPAIGFKCGLNHGHANYRDIAYTILFCKNLRESFDVSERFEPIAQQFGLNRLEMGETDAKIIWDTHEDAPEKLRLITDLSFATLALMGMWLKAVHGLSVKSLEVRHKNDSYSENYTEVFDCPIKYGASKDALTFDKRFLEFPLPGANARMLAILTQRLERDLKVIDKPVSDRQRVVGYIESLLGNEPPSLTNICRLIGCSERTLHRRLRKENTTFRELLETVRRERYQLLSAQDNLSQIQIAGLLGYSEQSAFSRAYKSWFGVSPLKDKKTI